MAVNKVSEITSIQDQSLLIIENTLLACFEEFKKSQVVCSFDYYKRELETSNLCYVFDKYPVAENILKGNVLKTADNKSAVLQYFFKDSSMLEDKEMIENCFVGLKDIETGIGDFHKGMSTAFVNIQDQQKIVFKPTAVNITESYFELLDWVNQHYELGDYRYKVSPGNNYHWLEFVNHVPCQSIEELKLYYERAGFTLGTLYLLNAVDFHYENVVSKGVTPVMIDHETIIQPKVHPMHLRFFKNFIPKTIEDSVMSTMLLPIHDKSFTTLPTGTCGFGYHKQDSIQALKKEAIDRYTDNWRFVTKFIEESFQKQNIPMLNGKAVYPVEYIDELLAGFEISYMLFLNNSNFLLNDRVSPLHAFNNNVARFIWRDTNLYTKIHRQMSLPKNLISIEHYERKIYDYLAVAFKNVPKDSNLMLIFKHEVSQMLKGDIPFFEVNTSSRDLETEFGIVEDFFEYSAVENVKRKIKKLSLDDLKVQMQLIKESLL